MTAARYPLPAICPVIIQTFGPHAMTTREVIRLIASPALPDRDPGDECDCEDCECSS